MSPEPRDSESSSSRGGDGVDDGGPSAGPEDGRGELKKRLIRVGLSG